VLGQPTDRPVDLADPETALVDCLPQTGRGSAGLHGGEVLVDVDRDASEAGPGGGVQLVEPGRALAEGAAAEDKVVSGQRVWRRVHPALTAVYDWSPGWCGCTSGAGSSSAWASMKRLAASICFDMRLPEFLEAHFRAASSCRVVPWKTGITRRAKS